MDWSWIPSAAQGTLDLGKFIYNIYTNERDFKYQQSLQNEIFNREDNAVQRRMADLKAAGLNPNLASGSGAGAGSVVGRSVTPTLSGNPIGTVLDSLSAQEKLKMERYENWKNEKERKLFNYETNTDQMANAIERAQLFKMMGINDIELRLDNNGVWQCWSPSFNKSLSNYRFNLTESPVMKQLDWQIQNQKNNAHLLQKDVEWYNADKIMEAIGTGARAAGNLMTPGLQILKYSRGRR